LVIPSSHTMADTPGAKAPPQDLKAENKRLAVQFKAQHALVVGFFTLIAYVLSNSYLIPS
jgi:hypothetical protein